MSTAKKRCSRPKTPKAPAEQLRAATQRPARCPRKGCGSTKSKDRNRQTKPRALNASLQTGEPYTHFSTWRVTCCHCGQRYAVNCFDYFPDHVGIVNTEVCDMVDKANK